MSADYFSQTGKVEAIGQLYQGTAYKAFDPCTSGPQNNCHISSCMRSFNEGLDFDLTYFPLKHLGHKAVTSVTGELLSKLSHPSLLNVVIGVSGKFSFGHIKELWNGMACAAKEYGYSKVSLDMVPSINGLSVNVAATGSTSKLTVEGRSKAKSKDLICVSGSLGAAYLGLKVLEREKRTFNAEADTYPALESYKMLVAAYLKPDLSPSIIDSLEEEEIYPSFGYFITDGLADTALRLARDSGLGVKIYAGKIPFEGNSFQLGKELNLDPISAAMNGGDDYKLLFTVPILSVEKFRKNFQTFDIIGHLAMPDAGTTLVTPDGVELPITAQAWK